MPSLLLIFSIATAFAAEHSPSNPRDLSNDKACHSFPLGKLKFDLADRDRNISAISNDGKQRFVIDRGNNLPSPTLLKAEEQPSGNTVSSLSSEVLRNLMKGDPEITGRKSDDSRSGNAHAQTDTLPPHPEPLKVEPYHSSAIAHYGHGYYGILGKDESGNFYPKDLFVKFPNESATRVEKRFFEGGKYYGQWMKGLNDPKTDRIEFSDLKTGKMLTLPISLQDVVDVSVNEKTESAHILRSDGTRIQWKLKSGEMFSEKGTPTEFGKILPDGRVVVTSSADAKVSPDGKWIASYQKGKLLVRSASDGSEVGSHSFSLPSVKLIGWNGNHLILEGQDPYRVSTNKYYFKFDAIRGGLTPVALPRGFERAQMSGNRFLNTVEYDALSKGRLNRISQIEDYSNLCIPLVKMSETEKNKNRKSERQKAFQCAANEKQQDFVMPLTQETAYQALRAMTQVFDPQKHLGILDAVLSSGFIESDPDLIATALVRVGAYSTVLYDYLLKKHTRLLQMEPAKLNSSELCLSKQANESLIQQAKSIFNLYYGKFYQHEPNEAIQRSTGHDWDPIRPLSPFLSQLPEAERGEMRDVVAASILRTSNEIPDLQTITSGTRRSLASQMVNPLFGFSRQSETTADRQGIDRVQKDHYYVRIRDSYHGDFPWEADFKHDNILSIVGSKPISIGKDIPTRHAYPELGIDLVNLFIPTVRHPEAYYYKHDNKEYRVTLRPPSHGTHTTEQEVNRYLNEPLACRIVQNTSHFVEDGLLEERLKENPERRPRVKIVSDSQSVLKACEELKNTLGPKKCRGVELSGHGAGLSVGVNGVFGYQMDWDSTRPVKQPSDTALFDKITACFDSMLEDNSPVIFTSCGGYSAQRETVSALATEIKHTVYAAAGLCSADGWGAHSEGGWVVGQPGTRAQVEVEEVTSKTDRTPPWDPGPFSFKSDFDGWVQLADGGYKRIRNVWVERAPGSKVLKVSYQTNSNNGSSSSLSPVYQVPVEDFKEFLIPFSKGESFDSNTKPRFLKQFMASAGSQMKGTRWEISHY